jgi:proteic killer suppression protein
MIKSFRHAGLEKFYKTGSKAGIQPHHATKLEEQLTALNRAKSADDMAQPASWRLHGLQREALVNLGKWKLALDLHFRRRGRYPRGLSGLPLRGRYAH